MRPQPSEPQPRERPSKEEIELRKQTRAGLRVERAVNEPGGRPAPASAPVSGEKE